MNDPYAVLGVSPSASDEEIKKAYRELVKKYHPDHYADNPLADLAEAKMKEVNEAYDTIVKMRTQGGGGYRPSGGGRGHSGGSQGGYQAGGQYGSSPYLQVRQMINNNDLAGAERLLRSSPGNTAEWYFLMGTIAYRRGWLDDARQNFWTACSMDPGNLEYRQAMNSMGMHTSRGAYQGDDCSTLCTTLCCLNCLCDSCT